MRRPELLKERLDRLYTAFDLEHVVSDPIWIVRRFRHPADREIVAFCAAAVPGPIMNIATNRMVTVVLVVTAG